MAPVPGSRIGGPDSTIWGLPPGTRRHSWAGSSGFANWTWSSLRSGTANSATTSTSETPMGSLWSSTPLMTVSRLPWMNCAAANSPTKSYWTGRSSWDWGRTSHGESYDSFGDLAGPETQRPTTATTAAPNAGFNRRCPTRLPLRGGRPVGPGRARRTRIGGSAGQIRCLPRGPGEAGQIGGRCQAQLVGDQRWVIGGDGWQVWEVHDA